MLRASSCCTPSAAQLLLLFWALLHCSVFVALCWTATLPHALRAAIDLAVGGALPPGPRLIGLAIGGGCTGGRNPMPLGPDGAVLSRTIWHSAGARRRRCTRLPVCIAAPLQAACCVPWQP